MNIYSFKRLIEKYKVPIAILVPSDGQYIHGKYCHGNVERHEIYGAVVPLGDQRQYESGGTVFARDKQMYLTQSVPYLSEGAQVEYGGCVYTVQQETDFSPYADVFIYRLQWNSNLGGDGGGG